MRTGMLLVCAVVAIGGCKGGSKPQASQGSGTGSAAAAGGSAAAAGGSATAAAGSGSAVAAAAPPPAAGGGFVPVPLPDPKIPGFRFPEAEAVIEGWAQANDQVAMSKHAWGIWTALTLDSGERYEGQPLRVFETWPTPDELRPGAAPLVKGAPRAGNPRPLARLRQLARRPNSTRLVEHGDDVVTGFVKYDPTAAGHITANQLLSKQQLATYLPAGRIPDFPSTAISLKPVFQTLPASKAVGGRYIQLDAWPGPPPAPKAFPQGQWGRCVWIDLQEPGDGPGKDLDATCAADGSSRTPATTYGLGRFIAFQEPSASGTWAVLVAMHVTSREIKRWTWATFFWSPTPDDPLAPSSKLIAGARPAQLTGAARNYAHCTADMMESPPQPNTGGKNVGNSVYCYNPWLEAGFGPGDLPDSLPGTYNGKAVANNVGVQTNCMSCHAAANYNPNNVANAPSYSGDRYLDLAAPGFQGTVQVDFLWSIADLAQ